MCGRFTLRTPAETIATHGTLSAALVAGKPVLNVPLQLEQAMLTKLYASWARA